MEEQKAKKNQDNYEEEEQGRETYLNNCQDVL